MLPCSARRCCSGVRLSASTPPHRLHAAGPGRLPAGRHARIGRDRDLAHVLDPRAVATATPRRRSPISAGPARSCWPGRCRWACPHLPPPGAGCSATTGGRCSRSGPDDPLAAAGGGHGWPARAVGGPGAAARLRARCRVRLGRLVRSRLPGRAGGEGAVAVSGRVQLLPRLWCGRHPRRGALAARSRSAGGRLLPDHRPHAAELAG